MGTFALVPADREYVAGLVSAFTQYGNYVTARAAAQVLSGQNSGAAVYTAKVEEAITAPGRVDLYAPSAQPGPEVWIVQLASTATYLPKSTAEAQAFTTSAANSNSQTFVAKVFETCTGP